MACGSSNPEDLAKNFTKDLYSGDTKSVMSYIDLSKAKSDEEKTINKDSAKIRVLVLFNNDNNQSSNVFLAKKDRKWLVLLK
ncbi:TPA: DUF4878 domain-containing protein [Campylobacter jejuni]|uniref:DUF4878 domain-containing protein n=1 Tax=Campylobacter jejuni TaxID=197 RepID=UPI00056E0CF9|nr:DUF4878 domain-containing protein [Campylobacter jejuni]EAH5385445.1 DUF4878 domain-containing protein [Campylobacter jejuni]EAH7167868.1 DUF4878 domain-containing protein [Campylobacter jejuni]EAH7622669.1 DUF4878 domain-containing protein [Campylobacter jejuni]EAH7855730.1 DUF4878 domain-containing protein [Campylobacter jejuni]EAH8595393.1 DUF4878 domain-containing protein [Campylobacter jejuni]